MTKKVEEKEVRKEKKVKKTNKKEKKTSKESFFSGVKAELAKVKWSSRQEVLKYTIAPVVFIIVVVVFFVLLSLFMSFIKGVFN